MQQTHQVPPLGQAPFPQAVASLNRLLLPRSKTRGQILSRRLVREGENGTQKSGEGFRKDYSKMTAGREVPGAAGDRGTWVQEEVSLWPGREGCVLL